MVTATISNVKKKATRKRKSPANNEPFCGKKISNVASNDSEDGAVVEEKKVSTVEEEKLPSVTSKDFDEKLQEIKVQVRRALTVLKKHFAETSGKSLFPDIDQAVGLTVVYKKPALTTNRARLKIILPSPPRTPQNTTICIIMPDLDQSAAARRDPDVDKQAREWAEKIEKDHGLTNRHYAKIMTKRQLEREYHTYSQRRALATMYDLFLVDARVGKAVRTFLGKDFYKVHKEPLDFIYSKPLVTAIERAVKTTVMKLQRYATRVHVSFGHLGQHLAELGSNFDEVIKGVVTWCPGGFLNIRSIYVQPVGSTPSLPVYYDDGNASEVQLERPKKRRRCIEQTIDECSTLPEGLKLAVRRNGKIRVLKEDTGTGVYYPTVHDEWEQRDTLKPKLNPERLKRKREVKKKRSLKRMIEKKIKSGKMVSIRPEKPKSEA
ncbi:hypothetical protein KIN20_029440 [Parelaphostrongylus tenuis]|uniref:Ribosomal protein L1 n=1 Tax=Parelaphostrongylus tenuis TaxID=148309 RepID=A0AAD5WFM7_PARTN|nr:hypothetical protein KIN20_029440 [Parelaphostrongylus tenuis]